MDRIMNKLKKHSKKRDVVLEVLCSTKSHPTAQWVYANIRGNIPLSLATVYRNLRQLKNDGTIISVGIVDGEERFDGFSAPHPHFICENCGSVIDLEFNEKEDYSLLIKSGNGNSIDYRKTTFYGLCKNCLN